MTTPDSTRFATRPPHTIHLVELPANAQPGPIFVGRHPLTATHAEDTTRPLQRGPAAGRADEGAFFNHDHSVLLLHEGEATIVEQAVGRDATAWTLEPGDVLVIPAGAPHRRRQGAPHGAFIAAAFCAACLDLDEQVTSPLHRVRAGAAPVVHIPGPRRAHVAHLFEELLSATTTPAVPVIVMKSLLTLLLHELARAQQHLSPTGDTLLADTLRYIERHCLGPLTLSDIAAHMHRTPSHLATLVKKATGQTILSWITMHRMAEARRRLRHSDEQVEVIAERVGYADPTHFIRTFRRHHGLTPAAWRRHRL